MPIAAVIFDNDGVIVDSEQYWHEMAAALFQEATADDIDVQPVLDDALGMNYRDIYDLLADRYDVTMEQEEFLHRYNAAADEVYREQASLMEGFHDLVAEITDRGCMVAIASSSPRRWLSMVVDRFDLDAIDLVVSADELKQEGRIAAGKPDPGIYRVTAQQLGVDPSACLVVEDAPNGVTAAKQAGMHCIAYRNDADAADATARSPAELRELVLERLPEEGF
ncbi:MAG: HAD family phosphatase [Candidatus Nanohaloarchaea archaeon]|nr:HAD family phosphatase [Candidatus Nanohaloarchaea archaeon]